MKTFKYGAISLVLAALVGLSSQSWAKQPQIVGKSPSKQVAPVNEINALDLNQANLKQLSQLPGIGKTRAMAIIEYREQHGPFTSKEQLMKIPGIGKKTYAKIEPEVRIK
ncbi:ComEA family DNA-binding protein [Dongshaea marina]|uniref:ComEA family DNA-binding protein n=1 Tax=Dongshaea marina TaxID=2047966 RepID=UPI00131EF37C|nr:helix-hairpin-helix domain-containing protein [Dongshaea marina]